MPPMPSLPPELLPKSMDRLAPFLSAMSNPPSSAGTSFNMPGLVLSHDLLGSQHFPGQLTIGQVIAILQRRGLSEGSPALELSIKMSSSFMGVSKTDSSKTQEAQEGWSIFYNFYLSKVSDYDVVFSWHMI